MPRFFALALFLASPVVLHSYDAGDAKSKPPASPEPKKDRKPAPRASPAPSYTNDDLKKDSASPSGEGAASPTREETPAYETESSEPPALVEEQWRSRADEARNAIQTAEATVRGLDEEAKALGLRVLMSTDTYEILDLRRQQQEMAEQVEQAKRSVVQAKQAQDDLETEARRAGAPPGWLRER